MQHHRSPSRATITQRGILILLLLLDAAELIEIGGANSNVTSIFELSNRRPARSHVYPVQGRVALHDKLICLRRISVLLDSESDGLKPCARLGLLPSR